MDVQQGFTLIELLVVIAIIGVLAAAAIPQITGAICDANGSTAEQALASFRTAWTQCTVDNSPSECTTLDEATYQEYIGTDAIDHLSASWTAGDELATVSYNRVGCQYNVNDGGGISNAIVWNAVTGNITNL